MFISGTINDVISEFIRIVSMNGNSIFNLKRGLMGFHGCIIARTISANKSAPPNKSR